ncbi:MAG: DivIVA domain-containing protein [Firmicutes bacterium]|nr:DivIVA domain-containing protein [Bacillota bacterium]
MIAPHEIKEKEFTKAVRGYNTTEVDEYIDFLIDKYTELYKYSAELEQKLNSVKAKYDELSDDEESIRSAILKAQKLGEAIVNNAKTEADNIAATVDSRCDEVIRKAKDKLDAERESLRELRRCTDEFKQKLYDEYVAHLKMIKEMDFGDVENTDNDIPTDEQLEEAGKSAAGNTKEKVKRAAASVDDDDILAN